MKEEHEKSVTAMNIPHNEFKTMIREFRKHSRKPTAYEKEKHIKSVWFPLEQIQKMCEQISQETNGSGGGIRIYFGRYPNDVSGFTNNRKIKPNSNTVILVSTKDVDGVHQDYFTKVAPGLKAKDTPPENRGEQCRPYCDGTTDDGEDEPDPIA